MSGTRQPTDFIRQTVDEKFRCLMRQTARQSFSLDFFYSVASCRKNPPFRSKRSYLLVLLGIILIKRNFIELIKRTVFCSKKMDFHRNFSNVFMSVIRVEPNFFYIVVYSNKISKTVFQLLKLHDMSKNVLKNNNFPFYVHIRLSYLF